MSELLVDNFSTLKKLKNRQTLNWNKIAGERTNIWDKKSKDAVKNNRKWKEEHIQKDWQRALIVLIYKMGDRSDCKRVFF